MWTLSRALKDCLCTKEISEQMSAPLARPRTRFRPWMNSSGEMLLLWSASMIWKKDSASSKRKPKSRNLKDVSGCLIRFMNSLWSSSEFRSESYLRKSFPKEVSTPCSILERILPFPASMSFLITDMRSTIRAMIKFSIP